MIESVRRLSQVNNVRAAFVVLRQWLVIAGVVAVAAYCNHWLVYAVAVVVIASRQHALVILMHDATHYRLFSNRTANDLLSDLFCAFPLGITTLGYRLEHLPHHGHVNTMDDPYYAMFQKDSVWHWPKTRWGAFRVFLADVFVWNLVRNLKMGSQWMAGLVWWHNRGNSQLASRCVWDVVRYFTFLGAVLASVTMMSVWWYFLLLWVLPSVTFFMLFVRLRWISEHAFRPATDELHDTRHVQGTLLERLFIAPLNVNNHVAHHVFTSIPFYNLPAMQKRLMQLPYYKDETQRFRSYFSSKDSVIADLLHYGAEAEKAALTPATMPQ